MKPEAEMSRSSSPLHSSHSVFLASLIDWKYSKRFPIERGLIRSALIKARPKVERSRGRRATSGGSELGGDALDLYLDDEAEIALDPMDTVETVIASDDRFQSERAEDGDVHFSFKCSWGESVGYFSFRHELPALLFTLGFDLQAPKSRYDEAVKLAAQIRILS